MKTWAEVKAFIEANGLQYKVERYNMSNRGTLVGLVSAQPFAYTVKDAARLLRSETGDDAGRTRIGNTPSDGSDRNEDEPYQDADGVWHNLDLG